MTLKELVQKRNKMLQYPEEWKTENQGVFRVLEELINKKREEYRKDEEDATLNARIEKWITEGRITFDGGIG